MNKLRLYSLIVGILALVYVYTYTLPIDTKLQIVDFFSLSPGRDMITGHLTKGEYLGECTEPNQLPYFNDSFFGGVITLYVNESFTHQIGYVDPDGDPVLVLAEGSWDKLTEPNVLNYSGYLNLTNLRKQDVGMHMVTFYAHDACNYPRGWVDSDSVNFSILNINVPPEIIGYSPEIDPPANVSLKEGNSTSFNITVYDPDLLVNPNFYNETLTYNWYLDTELNYTSGASRTNISSFTFSPGFCDSGLWNVSVNVTDKEGESDIHYWLVDVEDVNRPPHQNASFPHNITINETKDWSTDHINVLNLNDYIIDPDVIECSDQDDNITYISHHPFVLVDQASGNITINTTEYYFGNFTVNFTATDTKADSLVTGNLWIIVENIPDAPILNSTSQMIASGYLFEYLISAFHPDGFNMSFDYSLQYDSDEVEPGSVGFDTSTGNISFTPELQGANTQSIIRINITATDDGHRTDGEGPFNSSTTFNLTVFLNEPPQILDCRDITTTENQMTTIDFRYLDPEGDDVEISFYNSWFSFSIHNSTHIRAEFTPLDEHAHEIHTITVNLTDIWDMSGSCTFDLTVIDINNPPVLEISDFHPLRIGYPYYYEANVTDLDHNDIHNFTDNATFFNISTQNRKGIINISEVEEEHEGLHIVNITVCDDGNRHNHTIECDTKIVEFLVERNSPPYFIDLQDYFECEQYSVCIMEFTAGDPENDILNFSVNVSIFNITSTFNETTNHTLGRINFTPYMRPGTINFTLTVTDPWGDFNSTEVILNITEVNTPPEVSPENSTLNIVTWVNEPTEVHIYVHDREDDEIGITLNDTSLFNLEEISKSDHGTYYETYFNASFTPLDNGTWIIEMNITDGTHYVYENLTIEVRPENHPPVFGNFSPADPDGEPLILLEKDTLELAFDVSDPEGDDFIVEIFLNNQLAKESNETSQNYTFTPGWYDAGEHYIKAVATDEYGKNSSVEWRVQVLNRNRLPIGCKRVFNSTMDLDWLNNSILDNVEMLVSGEFALERNPSGNYYQSGYLTFPTIYFRTEDVINPSVILSANFSEYLENSTSCFTNLSIQYRYGRNSPPLEMINQLIWSSWSPENYTLNQGLQMPDNITPKYWNFRVNFHTTCQNHSPLLESAHFSYSPRKKTFLQGANMSQWVFMDDFFYDPDADNLLSFDYNTSLGPANSSPVSVHTDPPGRTWPPNDWLYIASPTLYTGDVIINLFVHDEYDADAQCAFNLSFMQRPSDVGTQIRYEIQTRTEVIYEERIVEKEIPELISFNLLVPESVTMYPNDTIVVPITLDNYGNHTLKNIKLFANSSHEQAELLLSKDDFELIPAGHQERTELFITAKNIHGQFDVWVQAYVEEPHYNDTAKIIMATLEKGEHNSTQLNTKVTYTKDLLRANLECAELYEMIDEAERLIQQGNLYSAEEILRSATEACKYIVSLERPQDITVSRRATDIRLSLENNAFIIMFLIAASFVLLVVLIYWITLPKKELK